MWSPLGHNKAFSFPQNHSLVLHASSGGGPSGCPQETGNSDPGLRQEESKLLATSSIPPREETHPMLTQTSEDILVLPSVYTSKCGGVLPTGQRAAVGAIPIGTSRGVWRLLLCPPLAYRMSSSCLWAASGLDQSLPSAFLSYMLQYS